MTHFNHSLNQQAVLVGIRNNLMLSGIFSPCSIKNQEIISIDGSKIWPWPDAHKRQVRGREEEGICQKAELLLGREFNRRSVE